MASETNVDNLKKARMYAKENLTKKITIACEVLDNCDDPNLAQGSIFEVREALKTYQLAHEAYHVQLIDETDRQASNDHYRTCLDRVAEIENKFKSLVTQRIQSTSQLQPPDSMSDVGSKMSKTSSVASSKAKAAAKKAALKAKAAMLKNVQELEAQELQIKQKKTEVELLTEIAAAEAEEQVYEQFINEEEQSSISEGDANVSEIAGDLISKIFHLSTQANGQETAGQSTQANAQETAGQSTQANAQETAGQSTQANVQETAGQFTQSKVHVTACQSAKKATYPTTAKSAQTGARYPSNVKQRNYVVEADTYNQPLNINQWRSTPSADTQGAQGFISHSDTGQTPLSTRRPDYYDPQFSGWPYHPNNQYSNQSSSFQEEFVSRLLETQTSHNRALEETVKQQQKSVAALNLPQPTVQVFNGDPVEYCEFIRAFEHLIESKTLSASARLYYLVQYTSGSVQELMRSCLSMEPEKGYNEAKRLLKERYGQAHRIATAHIKRLVEGPPIKEDGVALKQFSIQLTSCTNTLTEVGYITRLDSPDFLRKIIDRLPFSMRMKWRDTVDNILEKQANDVTVKDITDFVTAKAGAASHPVFGKIDVSKPATTTRIKPPPSSYHKASKAISFGTQFDQGRRSETEKDKPKPKCPLCDSSHWLVRCDKFKAKSTEERLKFVRDKKLCDNCLPYGHYVRSKDSFCKVEGCTHKHSTFLHQRTLKSGNEARGGSDAAEHTNSSQGTSLRVNNGFISMSTQQPNSKAVSLAIVPVKVKVLGRTKNVETYAFLDSGSNTTFCTEDLLTKLDVKGNKTTLSLTTLKDKESLVECQLVSLEVSDRNEENVVALPRVFSTRSLPVCTRNMAKQSDLDSWQHLSDINVPKIDAEIGLLIGSDVPAALAPHEVKRGRNEDPYATKTLLGWTVNGPLSNDKQNTIVNVLNTEESLSNQFERYCNLEFKDTASEGEVAMSQNDRKALEIMESTTKLENNHYEIALPWKEFPPKLEDNRPMAERRLHLLKGRFEKDRITFDKYKQFIEDLIVKDYARQVTSSDDSIVPIWYLPHHSVRHPQKPDKVRVVFDCSAKWQGTSLNDHLFQGPDLTNSLVGVLTRFRQEPIALMSDIEAMFHQVRVRPIDRNALRFLW